MRLLNVKTLEFTKFRGEKPKYVAASHRWVDGHETTFKDVRKRRNTTSIGYKKVEAFARYVRDSAPGVEWLWIDTCCVNQEDAAELSEAVNLMFEWYRDAERCVAYLADVTAATDKAAFEESEWFRRGWTLQELLGPRVMVFVTKEWAVIGKKGGSVSACDESDVGPSLEGDISRITGIPQHVLHDYETSMGLTVNERLKWMDGRQTTREEDMSYALYGIFGVTPGANYGEGYNGARQRLLGAIRHRDKLTAQQAKPFRKIADWIAAPDPWTNHQSARQRHEPHTGSWLLQSAEYQSWKSGSARHLWVHGKAGCGKTILCSTAIEDIQAYCEGSTNSGHAIFYFSFSDSQKQSYENLLRSVAVQLGWKEPGLSMLQQAFNKPNRSLPTDEMEKIVFSCIDSYDEVFLSLDALDECPEDSEVRQNVLECLERLSQNAPKLRMLATSRDAADIDESMELLGAVSISTETQSVDADIRSYVSSQLSRDKKLRQLDLATKALIEGTISRNADGMFRWAYCQLRELKTLPSTKPKYVKETLRALPLTLDATYERMLTGIKQMFRQEALILLRWLAYAESPLSLGELAEAAIIDLTGEGCVDVDERGSLEDTLNILSGLVVVQGVDVNSDDNYDDNYDAVGVESKSESLDREDYNAPITRRSQGIEKDTKVRLAHFSVKEYLESPRILQGEAKDFYLKSATAHRFLARSCVTYIIHYSGSSGKSSTNQDLVIFPLLQYAARSWTYHSSMQEIVDVACETSLLSLQDVMLDWLLVHQPDLKRRMPFNGVEGTGSGLYYASFAGLDTIVRELLRIKLDVNAQGGIYGNALQAASWGGYQKVVQMLMDAGADINAQGGIYGNALQAASLGGYDRVVQMLIDAGADVNTQGGFHGNALRAASLKGYEKVVQMLIDAGADVNAQRGDYSSALQAASQDGHEKVVLMLINAGADVNTQRGDYNNALQVASRGGYEKIVLILINAGADVSAQGGVYGNALLAASLGGYEKVVQMLIDAGADVNAQGGHHGNALQAASLGGYGKVGGHEKVVQMLIDAGADVNAQGGYHGNALQAASLGGYGKVGGYEKVVLMLINAGADVNAQGGDHGNALQAASLGGYEKVVQMLMDAGADVSAQGGTYGNALQAASWGGYEKVVQMLMDAGADVNTQGGDYGNALQAASWGGYQKVVQMLIDAGADINAQGGHYSNALQAASEQDHEKVVQMLVDAGADAET